MSTGRNAPRTGLNRSKRVVPALVVVNVVLGLAFVMALAFAWFESASSTDIDISSGPAGRERHPLAAQANVLIAGLHCPCPGCGHSKFRNGHARCGERNSVHDFVVRHLRSGTDAVTVLAHVKDRFGDLTSVATAQAAWEARPQSAENSTGISGDGSEELPPDFLQLLEQQPERT